MKKYCINCTHFKNEVCTKNSKNGYNKCAKYKAIPIPDLISERKKLLIDGSNQDRLNYLTQKLQEINGGIV